MQTQLVPQLAKQTEGRPDSGLELRLLGWLIREEPEGRLERFDPLLDEGRWFGSPACQRIYRAARELGGGASDEAIVELLGTSAFDAIGGTECFRMAVFDADLTTEAQARVLAGIARERHGRAELILALRRATDALSQVDGRSVAEIQTELEDRLLRIRETHETRDRLAQQGRSMRSLLESNLEKPAPILGHGAVRRGDYMLVYGKSGLGKSQLAVRLAWAWTTGEPFFGLATHGPFRVGLVTPELDSATVAQRYSSMQRLPADQVLGMDAIDRLHVLDRDTLVGTLDLRRERDQREVIQWIEHERLDVVILDALTDVYGGSVFGDEWCGLHADFLTNLHKRTATGCTPVVFHHQSDKTDDSPTGSGSVFTGESSPMRKAALAFWLHRLRGGIVLENVKHRRIRKLPDIWLELDELGVPRVTDAPLNVAERKAGKLDELAEWIREQGGTATTEGIMRQAGVRSNKTARQYAKNLGGTIGAGRNAVWTFPNLTRNAEGGK